MVLYALYVFSRAGNCIHYQDWNRGSKEPMTAADLESNQKLCYGLLFSLKRFCARTSPLVEDQGVFRTYTCTAYRLHYYDVPTGLKIVVMSDPRVDYLGDDLLVKLYHIYVDTCSRNPLYVLNSPITHSSFIDASAALITSHKSFSK